MTEKELAGVIIKAVSILDGCWPLYGRIIKSLVIIRQNDMPVAMRTNGTMLDMNKRLLMARKVTEEEMVWSLAHEACHVLFGHPWRLACCRSELTTYAMELMDYDQLAMLFNISMDFMVNGHIAEIPGRPDNMFVAGEEPFEMLPERDTTQNYFEALVTDRDMIQLCKKQAEGSSQITAVESNSLMSIYRHVVKMTHSMGMAACDVQEKMRRELGLKYLTRAAGKL